MGLPGLSLLVACKVFGKCLSAVSVLASAVCVAGLPVPYASIEITLGHGFEDAGYGGHASSSSGGSDADSHSDRSLPPQSQTTAAIPAPADDVSGGQAITITDGPSETRCLPTTIQPARRERLQNPHSPPISQTVVSSAISSEPGVGHSGSSTTQLQQELPGEPFLQSILQESTYDTEEGEQGMSMGNASSSIGGPNQESDFVALMPASAQPPDPLHALAADIQPDTQGDTSDPDAPLHGDTRNNTTVWTNSLDGPSLQVIQTPAPTSALPSAPWPPVSNDAPLNNDNDSSLSSPQSHAGTQDEITEPLGDRRPRRPRRSAHDSNASTCPGISDVVNLVMDCLQPTTINRNPRPNPGTASGTTPPTSGTGGSNVGSLWTRGRTVRVGLQSSSSTDTYLPSGTNRRDGNGFLFP